MRDRVHGLGLQVRSPECEVAGDKVIGIAVHIGARVGALAGPDQVLVSSTVKDLVASAGLKFGDRGTHTIKGNLDEWRLFAVQFPTGTISAAKCFDPSLSHELA